MKHMLKIHAMVLLAIATGYLGIFVFSTGTDETGVLIMPFVMLAILSATTILEVDRRLTVVESKLVRGKAETDDE